MTYLTRALAGAAPFALMIGLAPAQAMQPATNSLPQPIAITDTIPAAQDVPYPGGTIQLAVDATDVTRGIFTVKETIPVAQAGKLTLLFPKWLPGNHSPTGQISKLAGLVITADGKTIPWVRDTVDVYAFHLDLPAGAKSIEAQFSVSLADHGQPGPHRHHAGHAEPAVGLRRALPGRLFRPPDSLPGERHLSQGLEIGDRARARPVRRQRRPIRPSTSRRWSIRPRSLAATW